MRIVAGEFGGRRIAAPSGRETRPTPERVREALFSMLGPLDGKTVLDLYAGSGALGIEALSRGAEWALLVDNSRRAIAAIKRNVHSPQIPERTGGRGCSVSAALGRWGGKGHRFDAVCEHPPYADAAKASLLLDEKLPGLLSADAVIVAESDRRDPIELTVGQLDRERRYGDTLIRIFSS
ncbi:MAG TPA: RsmD family RNA methyltransferase [Baekduia sp.]|nr:RsmD family RNA methyltransferase [Baekduia sp.]